MYANAEEERTWKMSGLRERSPHFSSSIYTTTSFPRAAKYNDAGLVVIGMHTPEFSFEHEPMNVENAFPVTIDSKY
jgi:hypothetical protein